jgi:hypothetical protein
MLTHSLVSHRYSNNRISPISYKSFGSCLEYRLASNNFSTSFVNLPSRKVIHDLPIGHLGELCNMRWEDV